MAILITNRPGSSSSIPDAIYVKATLSSGQSVPWSNVTDTLIAFDSVTNLGGFNTDSGFNTTTHKYTASRAGYFKVAADISTGTSPNDNIYADCYVNGNPVGRFDGHENASTSSWLSGSIIVPLALGDVLDVRFKNLNLSNADIGIYGSSSDIGAASLYISCER